MDVDAILAKLTPAQRKRLAREIAMACEKSYRRGFHQGFYAATECPENARAGTLREVHDWRMSYSRSTRSPLKIRRPPEHSDPPRARVWQYSALSRASESAGTVGAEIVRRLADEAEMAAGRKS